eukprot:GEMP01014373.1.p2 GENE.GEMP01014373.1~~GEMP01014373.1.p2  ORF type:complete len:137 (-),score=23.79 GEMP01014373.1:508-918(-)
MHNDVIDEVLWSGFAARRVGVGALKAPIAALDVMWDFACTDPGGAVPHIKRLLAVLCTGSRTASADIVRVGSGSLVSSLPCCDQGGAATTSTAGGRHTAVASTTRGARIDGFSSTWLCGRISLGTHCGRARLLKTT